MPNGGKREGAGRKAGVPNKNTRDVQEMLDRLGVNPFEGMARIASGDVSCGTCHGALKTRYKLPEGHHVDSCASHTGSAPCNCEGIGLRTCESCYGTNKEKVTPDLRGKMYSALAEYVGSKRKAVEISNPDGSMKPPGWAVFFVGDEKKEPTQ